MSKSDWKKPSENQHFCVVPWTHHYISPQSERRLCCASREEHTFVNQYIDSTANNKKEASYSPQSLEEYWNSPYVRDIRLKMLRGEPVDQCVVCQTQELSLSTYKDYFTRDLFKHHIDTIFDQTDEEGFTDLKCRSFDYRLFNTCNYKCRMCGDLLSSSWEAEKRKHNLWNPEGDPWMIPEINKQINDYQSKIASKEFKDALLKGEVEEIYWVGGEPLVWEEHWEYMQMLVDKKLSQKVFCRYNTNLSVIDWKGTSLFDDLLPHFKGYMIQASIDATGDIGEYIRTGLSWDNWVENFEKGCEYISKRGPNSLVIDLTLTLPGLFDVKNLVEFANKYNVWIYTKLVYAFDPSITISPLALPRDVLDRFVDDIISDIKPFSSEKTQSVIDTLEDLKRRQTHQEKFPEKWHEGFKRGRESQLFLEKIRKSKISLREIYSRRPEILEWWDRKI